MIVDRQFRITVRLESTGSLRFKLHVDSKKAYYPPELQKTGGSQLFRWSVAVTPRELAAVGKSMGVAWHFEKAQVRLHGRVEAAGLLKWLAGEG